MVGPPPAYFFFVRVLLDENCVFSLHVADLTKSSLTLHYGFYTITRESNGFC